MNALFPSRRRFLTAGACALLAGSRLANAAAMPSIRATLLDGRLFSSEDALGKVLLVNFWATWCAPCRAEMPAIDAYYQQHRERGLEVLALSTDNVSDIRKVQDVAKAFTFPVAMLKASQVSGLGRIWRMPVSALIDRKGQLVKQDWFVESGLNAQVLDAAIGPLL